MRMQAERIPVFVQVVLLLALCIPQVRAPPPPPISVSGPSMRDPRSERRPNYEGGQAREAPSRRPNDMGKDYDDDDDDDDDDRKKSSSCDEDPSDDGMDGNYWGQRPQMGWGKQPPQMGPWGGQGQDNWGPPAIWSYGPPQVGGSWGPPNMGGYWGPPQMGNWGQFGGNLESVLFGLGGMLGGDFGGDFGSDWDIEDLFGQGSGKFPPRGSSNSNIIKKIMMMAKIKKMIQAASFAKGIGSLIGGMSQFGGAPFAGPFGSSFPGGPSPFPGGPGSYPGGFGPYPGGPGPRPGPPPFGPKPRGKRRPRPDAFPYPCPKPKRRPPMLPRPQVCKVQAGNMSIERPCWMKGTTCSLINKTRCPEANISICLPRECTGMTMMETKICVLKLIKRKMESKGMKGGLRTIVEEMMKKDEEYDDDEEDDDDDDEDEEEEDPEMMDIEISPFLGCIAPDGDFAKLFQGD